MTWTILEKFREGNKYKVKVQCECGKICIKRSDYLKDKRALDHCGCKKNYLYDNVKINDTFENLTVIDQPYIQDGVRWIKCKCECGIVKDYRLYSILNKDTKSCGCKNNVGNSKHNESNTALYKYWTNNIVPRCKEWDNFLIFKEWYLCNKKTKLVLDRIDLTQPYSPNNAIFRKRKYTPNIEKTKSTNQQRYGVSFYSQTSEFGTRRKNTNLTRYGYEYPIQSPSIKSKIEKSNLEKYGTKSPLHNLEIRTKIDRTNEDRYGNKIPSKNPQVAKKIQQSKIDSGYAHCIDGKTTKDIAEEKGIAKSTVVKWIKNYGEYAVNMEPNISSIEQSIKQILDKNNIPYVHNKAIGQYRPDFILNDSIILECDGLYWHSDAVIANNNYHVEKRQYYLDQNYIPIFFREDEIKYKLPIVESIINNKLGLNKRIYARKCKIVASNDNTFFKQNHLMGSGTGSILYLIYNNEIVAGIQFYCKNNINEISRFCTLNNYSVVGGLSKLLSQINKPISTFIDLRYGSGQYLTKLNFKLETCYKSFRWVKGEKNCHRMKFSGNSGYKYGYNKLWDCGQAKYVLYD